MASVGTPGAEAFEVAYAHGHSREQGETLAEAIRHESSEAVLDLGLGVLGRIAFLLVEALPVGGEAPPLGGVAVLAERVEGGVAAAADRARLGEGGKKDGGRGQGRAGRDRKAQRHDGRRHGSSSKKA